MQSYLITDPKYYSQNPQDFAIKLRQVYSRYHPDFVCFRDKDNQTNFKELATVFLSISKEFGIKNIFINSDLTIATELGYDGVHLTSSQVVNIPKAKSQNLKIILSTHKESDIKQAIKEGIEYITYSPIYSTPNKGKIKGLKNLKGVLIKFLDIKIFALGGIVTQNHIEQVKRTNPYGFASIRYFVD